jgi:hypothetical protein
MMTKGSMGGVAVAALVGLTGGAARAQAPQAPAPVVQPAAPAPAQAVPHHTAHHRHRAHRHQAAVTPLAAPAPSPVAAENAGTAPAPVPNEDAGPPRAAPGTAATVTPGSMSIHYPPTGDGFLPGSSSSDMDNHTTPAVPGVQYQAPIANPAPQALPPPGNGQ